jgi:prevent-host-death family protein
MTNEPSSSIGDSEAADRFSELLQRVCGGEAFTITSGGSPIARLIPVLPSKTEESRQQAIVQMRELASQNQLNGLTVKELKAEGRR